jgi:hypothetical protein
MAKSTRSAPAALKQKAAAANSKGRSGGIVDAPGKRHRKPMPSTGGRPDDSRIAKMKVANEMRTRRHS